MTELSKKKIKLIHFVGIKGVGMAPLAIIAKEAGFKVTGSDIADEFITDISLKNAGIVPLIGFSKEHVKNPDLVIFTGAHGGQENVEVLAAKNKEIPVMTQGEAVGTFMDGKIFNRKFDGISVAGSHGKTTVTAMISTILKDAGLDPSFLIGTGSIASLGSCGHFGRGKYFVAEADEYATEPNFDKTPKLLWQHPKIAVFTNIELDHPDLFDSVDDIRSAFLKFANQLPQDGVLIACGDDPQNQKLIKEYGKKVITYGFSPGNSFVIRNIRISGDHMFFWVDANDTSIGGFMTNIVGEHNGLNAMSAIIVALECGLTIEKIREGIKKFTGTKRRFEYIGRLNTGAVLYDDYAHHPTEIKKTLFAFRQSFPKSKIVCVFQPHTYSRTKILFDDFLHSFNYADTVILINIYPSQREKPDPSISSSLLTEGVKKFHKEVFFLPKLPDVVKYIKEKGFGKDTVVITMGAGDVYKISEFLISN
ncbi:MAG: UDP-N-acetylmuramate--L-alanine ligase [Candidatus Levybacteria bacterium]|nr:UDP-N-acetylmuramate--L-alanine ligase [Candidatus Levybacteria bacterium]